MLKKIMTGAVVAGFAVMSQGVWAQCSTSEVTIASSNTGTTHTHTVVNDCFIVENFEFKTSANVALAYLEDATGVGAQAESSKGKNTFAGSSNGGSVGSCGDKDTEVTTSTSMFCAGGSVGSGS